MVRKLKFHEKKLLKKVDFISWEVDNNLHEVKVMRKYNVLKREDYTLYNRISREIRETAKKIKELDPKDPFRTDASAQLLEKLFLLGLIPTRWDLGLCDKVTASSFCRRRLPVVMVRNKMSETVKMATQYVQQGHIRVGPELVKDPAFLVTKSLEDYVTWVDTSAIKRHVLKYNDQEGASIYGIAMKQGSLYESTNTRKNSSGDDVEEEVQYFFDKKFSFKRPVEGWHMVPPEKMFTTKSWEVPQMTSMKSELNAMKDKLNDLNLEEWHKHTRATNPAGNVIWNLKNHIQPELLTQAWCKFYEVCSSYPIIPKMAEGVKSLNSVHLCEAPGAFITALNHFLRLNHPHLKWDWIATTLNPHYEENELSVMITDDRFLLLTLDKWKFGPDHTGDIMDLGNLKALVSESTKMGPILLVTADGSIDCQDNPAEQEELVSPLMFCQVVAALHILSIGGSLVVKAFTMYEHPAICLMYLLNAFFESVHVYKPVTSKEGNSETYVVCINYSGTDQSKAWLRQLRTVYGHTLPTNAMFPLLQIPEMFIEQLLQCSELFKNYQEEVLERNIVLFNIEYTPSIKRIKSIKHRVAEVFVDKYRLQPLASEQDEIVGKTILAKAVPLQMDLRCDDGTFNEKKRRDNLPPIEKLTLLLEDLTRFPSPSIWKKSDVKWLQFPPRSIHFKILRGKPVQTVRTSKFCSGKLLKLRYQIEHLVQQVEDEKSDVEWEISDKLSEPIKRAIAASCPDILKEKCQILNFKNCLWTSVGCGKNHEMERKALLLVCRMLENAWRDLNIIVEGYPMLTQFSTGIVFMVAHQFEQVGFVKPQGGSCAVVFRSYRSLDRAMATFMEELTYETDRDPDAGPNQTMLSILPINLLVENEFYGTVVAANMLTLRGQLTEKISRVISARD